MRKENDNKGSGVPRIKAPGLKGHGLRVICIVGGVKHCRLAKFRGSMHGGKYSAAIGRKTRFFVCALPSMIFSAYGLFSANHSAVFPPVHQTTEYRQTTVVDPSQYGVKL
jgi:hypothetical protein